MFRIATSAEDLRAAARLVNAQYARRDYGSDHVIPGGTTFVAEQAGQIVGTVTLVVKAGRVCELVRLASVGRSKDVLAGLFALAFRHGVATTACRELRIEVSPRHAAFYRAALGFEAVGPQYVNAEVDAPAQMLRIDVAEIRRRVRERAPRSLYACFPAPSLPDLGARSMRVFVRQLFTERDNSSADLKRVLWALSVVWALGMETWCVVYRAGQTFDLGHASLGVGGLIAAGGASLALNRKNENGAP
jgi:hypothetical protein